MAERRRRGRTQTWGSHVRKLWGSHVQIAGNHKAARLGEAVALEDGATEDDLEVLLDGGAERRATADHEAQAPAEALLDGAEHDVVQQRRRLDDATRRISVWLLRIAPDCHSGHVFEPYQQKIMS